MLPQDTEGMMIIVSVVVLCGYDHYSSVHRQASDDNYVDSVAADFAFSV
jgi:hypothetical protein